MSKQYLNHLKGLDVLRFFLSLSIIIWHYQHFFFPFVGPDHREAFLEKQPFFEFFKLFYVNGASAVQVFWLISGVIFYKVYEREIRINDVSFKTFIHNRFSRLYPLHLLTLLIVFGLQHYFMQTRGSYFVYPHNTAKAFIQNLLFIQSWGLNKFSFNGPTWSVSVEILVYFTFFMFSASGFLSRMRNVALIFLIFLVVKKWDIIFLSNDPAHINNDIAACFYFFFMGCLLVKIIDFFNTNGKALYWMFALTLALWLLTQLPGVVKFSPYATLTGYLEPEVALFSVLLVLGFILFFNLPIFSSRSGKFFQFFGSMTYSTYLIHFPVQLAIFTFLQPKDYHIFFSPVVFLSYLAIVFVLGRLSYVYFELPVQKLLRGKKLIKGPIAPALETLPVMSPTLEISQSEDSKVPLEL